MQEQLKEVVNSLGTAEKELVEKSFLAKLELWARLIDEVEAGFPYIQDISNANSYFQQIKQRYQQLLNEIKSLNIVQDANRVTRIQNIYQDFSQQYFERLLDQKQKIQAVTEDRSDLAALQQAIDDARIQAHEIEVQTANFEKSFKDNLEKQAKGSQKVLATYFKKRLKELKANDTTNPDKWLEKRNWWFNCLLFVIIFFAVAIIIIFINEWFKGYELQIAFVKVTVVALLYLQYHFASKNYHIYADLVAKYEHLAVISETMTDFTAAAFENEELNNVVYTNAAKTLFSEVNTGHLKHQPTETSIIENFINQIPKAG